ncbi:hypothetical protein BCV70DRAFT_197838 [Testicularia cyperi]|uniref:Uncharacterized protein n=1 Tax=Testicularia cyperi TaxID=1882483 RepID=A0A317Y0B8_9BASI|nr:hypothetical protein BCV70DRAFT_197838 [Testicularia cyperi]
MSRLLGRLLPLGDDPFPPTHVAGSEFEGFFIRLQSHSGRTTIGNTYTFPSNPAPLAPSSSSSSPTASSSRRANGSPSRIPRLAGRHNGKTSSSLHNRHARNRSSSASSSSAAEPPSPTPSPKTIRPLPPPQNVAAAARAGGATQTLAHMLTTSEPFYTSPDSFAGPSTDKPPAYSASQAGKRKAPDAALPCASAGDLIVVICELQSAPIDQRICIYLRWIVHGEEAKQQEILLSGPDTPLSSHGQRRDSKRPPNATPQHRPMGESFECTTYIPKWSLKLGDKAKNDQVQPFRIDLPCPSRPGDTYGFMSVAQDGNVVVDITVPRFSDTHSTLSVPGADGMADDEDARGTRVRIRTNRHVPWRGASSSLSSSMLKSMLPIGSQGPESWIQHLGPLLPLHWYVHSSRAPATFSLEHVEHDHAVTGFNQTKDAVAAGRASIHIEKNWGHGFPTGWMWVQGSSALPDPSIAPAAPSGTGSKAKSKHTEPSIRLMLAGGSILGLTAFLIGIRIKLPSVPVNASSTSSSTSKSVEINWDFTPPFALGPGLSVRDGDSGARIHYGLGFKMRRDFTNKSFRIEVWDHRRWARIQVHGDPDSFATQLPGPVPGGWAPGYCHHSYRCSATVTLFHRPVSSIPATALRSALHPIKTLASLKTLLRMPDSNPPPYQRLDPQHNPSQPELDGRDVIDQAWCHAMGWQKLGHFNLPDRVALEFGGDFAK